MAALKRTDSVLEPALQRATDLASRPTGKRFTLAGLTALALFLYVVLGQRLTISMETGGRGTVSPIEMAFVSSAALLYAVERLRRRRPMFNAYWLAMTGPLFFLLLLLPLLGVLGGDYSVRSLYGWILVFVPASILILGHATGGDGVELTTVAFGSIVAHGAYGLGQLLYRVGVLQPALWGWAVAWDADCQMAFSESYVLFGRSTGLFINPNLFGLWSVLAVVFSMARLMGAQRVIGTVLGLAGVVGSQSRTAAFVMVVMIVAYSVLVSARRPVYALAAILVALLSVSFGLLVGTSSSIAAIVEIDFVDRMVSGVRVLERGWEADTNLSLRVGSWAAAWQFSRNYPFGTLGPPQVLFGSFIDNQFVSFYLQGGVALVVAYGHALLAPIVLRVRGVSGATPLGIGTAVIAAFSFTQLPLESPASMSLLWIGVAVGSRPSKCRLHSRERSFGGGPH